MFGYDVAYISYKKNQRQDIIHYRADSLINSGAKYSKSFTTLR